MRWRKFASRIGIVPKFIAVSFHYFCPAAIHVFVTTVEKTARFTGVTFLQLHGIQIGKPHSSFGMPDLLDGLF